MKSRRDFLKESFSVVSLGLAVPSVFSRAVLASSEESYSLSAAGKTLVIVQLAGGYDGLNMVIPYTEGSYRDLRPSLSITDEDMLVIDDRVAFHPALREFRDLYSQGKLAVVEGVGYPRPNFSHFKAMDIWQTADPDGQLHDGWLGRYFDGLTDSSGHPLSGLSVGGRLPTAFDAAGSTVPAVESVETFRLQQPADDPTAESRSADLLRLYDIYRPSGTPFAALLDTTLDTAVRSSAELDAAQAAYEPAAAYPENSLATGLRLLAELIDSGQEGTPLRVGHVTLGGFDTHAQQTTRFDQLLTETSTAIAAFQADVEAHGHADDVLVMVWTEFGRRPRQNAQEGTDHGSAVPMFLVGEAVRGGFYGEPPSLTDLDDGNLRHTTDFRSVYATLMEDWLQAPATDILGAAFPKLDVWRS